MRGENTHLEIIGENGGYGECRRRGRPGLAGQGRGRSAVRREGAVLSFKGAHIDFNPGAAVGLLLREVTFGQTAVQIVGQRAGPGEWNDSQCRSSLKGGWKWSSNGMEGTPCTGGRAVSSDVCIIEETCRRKIGISQRITMFVDRVDDLRQGRRRRRAAAAASAARSTSPRAGPTAATAATAASVIVRAVAGTDSLAEIVNRKHWRAERGGRGGSANCHGRRAEDLVIAVPPGTLIYDRDRGNVLRDLTEAGERGDVARGGRGGRGNKSFATSTNRAPRETQPGTRRRGALDRPGAEGHRRRRADRPAQRRQIDAAEPAVAGATPEIADYPFTTKHPNLGLVTIGGERGFVLADLPGLIEGAHSGVGLGHEFLRHVERTRVLVHLVEPLPADGSDPLTNYRTIRRELELYGRGLADKPEIVAVSKAELTGSDEVRRAAGAANWAGRCWRSPR